MTKMLRVKMRWSGFIGGPGYSIFHFRDFGGEGEWDPGATEAAAAVARIDSFAQAVAGYAAHGVNLQAMGDVEEIEDSTGQLTDIIPVSNGAIRAASAAVGQIFAGPAGGLVNWRTGVVRNGRRVQGRTFLVPLSQGAYQDDGTLLGATVDAFSAAATALIDPTGTPDLGVYARPTPIKDGAGVPTGEYNEDGIWAVASGFNVPDRVSILRSRRD